MKNESTKHVKYGTRRVAEMVQNHMAVLFDDETGRGVFVHPDTLERFLYFDNPVLQERAEAAVMELKKKRAKEAEQHLVVYQLCEAKRRREQAGLLRKRRKAARERLVREKMTKVIQKGIRNKDESKEEGKSGRKAESTAGRKARREVLKKRVG